MIPPSPSAEDPFSYVSIILLIILLLLLVFALFFAFGSALRMGSAIAQSVGSLRNGTEHLQRGNFAHRIVVKGEDELTTLGNAFNDMAMNLESAQKTAIEKERLESELTLARRIQQRLLPGEPPDTPGLQLAGVSLPARQVGGDYYDFLPRASGNLVFVMADVSGKGAPAAILMSSLRASIHSMLPTHKSLDELVVQLNQIIHACTDVTEFITCFIGLINPNTGELFYVNAGHEPPYILHENGLTSRLDKGGLMLGAFPNAPYESGTVFLCPGDIMFLFTDGLTEANDRQGNMYGEARLDKLLQDNITASPDELLAEALSSVELFVDDAEASDDITLLSIRRTNLV